MRHIVNSKFWIGDMVYLRHRQEKAKGIIIGVYVYPNTSENESSNNTAYHISWPTIDSKHHEIELTSEYEQEF